MELRRIKIFSFLLLLAGLVLCLTGLWLLLSPAQYQAAARIKLGLDAGDIMGNGQGMSYDPYFIQTEFEVMQSQIVLGKVVEVLNLNAEWGKKYGDGTLLKTVRTVRRLQSRMKLEPIRNTKLIKISFTSDDPNEAAKVANAIAAAYQNYRLERLHQQTVGGIKVLTEQFRKGEQEIKSQRDKIDGLKKKIPEPVPEPTSPTITHSPLTNRPDQELPGTNVLIYFTAVRQLAAMEDLQELLAAKIEQEKFDLQIPKTSLVQIVDLAEPSQFPIGPNRWLGAASLLIGLALVGGGFILHKFAGPSVRLTS